jgi:hypothetical protein
MAVFCLKQLGPAAQDAFDFLHQPLPKQQDQKPFSPVQPVLFERN